MEQTKLKFTGSGFDILGRMILDFILTMVTLGLWIPWSVNGHIKYICSHIEGTFTSSGKQLSVEYSGSGVDILGRFIVWYILTLVTLGLYGPWMVNGFYKYAVEHSTLRTAE
jgi:uncharacterized membrane protein YjgN (DUF898 family)